MKSGQWFLALAFATPGFIAISAHAELPIEIIQVVDAFTKPANCAQQIIITAAKKNVAQKYGNSPTSGGLCALGVRQSLQLSKVGGVTGGLGNAIDYESNLPPHGFVDSGLRDPNAVTAGSVIVFSGPHSDQYLKNGNYGSPPGDWLGHVTIKGDDKYYYTDGRTLEPAIGWKSGKNVDHRRNVAGIFVPGPALVTQYQDKCAGSLLDLEPRLATVELKTSANESHVQEALILARNLAVSNSNRRTAFRQLLEKSIAAIPVDEEGQLTFELANIIQFDRELAPLFESELAAVPKTGRQDRCQSEQLRVSVARLLCFRSGGLAGQDFAGSEAPTDCPRPFDLNACLEGPG